MSEPSKDTIIGLVVFFFFTAAVVWGLGLILLLVAYAAKVLL